MIQGIYTNKHVHTHIQFAEARALVDRAVADAYSPTDASPQLLELGLWALVAAPPPGQDTAAAVAEEAAGLIQRLMALPGVAISLDAYEHACQVRAPPLFSLLLYDLHTYRLIHPPNPHINTNDRPSPSLPTPNTTTPSSGPSTRTPSPTKSSPPSTAALATTRPWTYAASSLRWLVWRWRRR